MLDSSTLYLVLIMAGFILVAVIVTHQHNCSDLIRRKSYEVENAVTLFTQKTQALEQAIVTFKTEIEEIDEQIDLLQSETPS
jgi:septal ring factor EnvC (AmiA/AmiB activator)